MPIKRTGEDESACEVIIAAQARWLDQSSSSATTTLAGHVLAIHSMAFDFYPYA